MFILIFESWDIIYHSTNLLAAAPTDDRPVGDPGPEQVLLPEEARKSVLPFVSQGPGEDFILIILFILFHVVCQITIW